MPTPAESGFRHGWSTMPKLRVGMPPMILAVMPQTAKVLLFAKHFFPNLRRYRGFSMRIACYRTKNTVSSVDLTCVLRVILIVSVLLIVRAHRLPGYIIASDAFSKHISNFLQEADHAFAQNRWKQAETFYKSAFELANDADKQKINQKLQLCYANTSLQRRYNDGSVVKQVRLLDRYRGDELLRQTWRLIKQNYYQKINTSELLDKSLWQLQAVTENPLVHEQYKVNHDGLKQLKDKIISVRNSLDKDKYYGLSSIKRLAATLCDYSEKAGLGASWPSVEIAYALCDSLGRYSYMLTPQQYQVFRGQLNGFYVGLGVDLIFEGEYPTVFDVVSNSPAQKSGILPNDIIINVDSQDLKAKTSDQVAGLLAGEENSKVKITIKRGREQIKLCLTREIIEAPTVRHVQLFDKGKIGYMRVAGFDNYTTEQMRNATEKLIKKGAKSLLIDLRCNGGGVVTSAIDSVRLFIDNGIIVTVLDANEKTKYRAGGDYFKSFSLPIAILVDKNTASAAEMFAAALRDNKRAVIIGEKTYGKAVVQTIYKANYSSTALCITTALYLPPSNICFNQTGIEPDIMVIKAQDNTEITDSAKKFFSQDNKVFKECINYLSDNFSS